MRARGCVALALAVLAGLVVLSLVAQVGGAMAETVAGAAGKAATDAAGGAARSAPRSVTVRATGDTLRIVQTAECVVPAGQVQKKDLYLWAQRLDIQGTLDGDIVAWFQTGLIKGTVTQDVNAFAQELTIDGVVGDDVRVGGQTITINGRVGGDVMVGGANVYVNRGAVIEGNLLVGSGTLTQNGTVHGDLKVGTGAFNMDGTVMGDAEISADGGVTLGENAHFGRDLTYKGPEEIAIAPGVVDGKVTFHRDIAEEEVIGPIVSVFSIVFRIIAFIGALIAGSVIFALTKDHARRTTEIIRRKPLKSLGIGFIAFICTPIIALICFILVVTAPLGAVVSLAYLAALYIAKFYVAAWLGNLILRRGSGSGSLIPGMLLGLVILYLVTAIPVLGTLLMFVIVFLGLGALLQRKETRLNGAFEAPAAEAGALPNTFPAFPGAPASPAKE